MKSRVMMAMGAVGLMAACVLVLLHFIDEPDTLLPHGDNPRRSSAKPVDVVVVKAAGGSPSVVGGTIGEDPAPVGRGELLVRVKWANGEPAAGTTVTVRGWSGERPKTARTDEGGEAQFARLHVGRVQVLMDRGGGVDALIKSGESVEVDFQFPPGVDLHGFVHDNSGDPIPNALVWLSTYGNRFSGRDVAQSDHLGHFRIRDLQPDRSIVVHRSKYAPSRAIELRGTLGSRELDVTLVPGGGNISVAVTDKVDGAPITGALVQIRPVNKGCPGYMSFESGVDVGGRGVFAGLWTDTPVEVFVQADGYAPHRETVVAGRHPQDIRVGLSKGATLSGRITNQAGNSVGGVGVKASWLKGGAFAVTREDGSFSIRDLPAGTSISLRAYKSGVGEATSNFTCGVGGHAEWSPSLSRGAWISGRVSGMDGRSLPNWMVYARLGGQLVSHAVTDETGSFVLTNLPSDASEVVLTAVSRLSSFWRTDGPVSVSIGARDVEIRVPPKRLHRVSATVPAGQFTTATLFSPGRVFSAQVDSRGRVAFEGVPPGDFIFRARRVSGSVDESQVNVPDDRPETDLGLMFGAHGTLILKVEDCVSPRLTITQLLPEGASFRLPVLGSSSLAAPLIVSPGEYVATCVLDGILQQETLTVRPNGWHVLRFRSCKPSVVARISNPGGVSNERVTWHLQSQDGQIGVKGEARLTGPERRAIVRVAGLGRAVGRCWIVARSLDSESFGEAFFDLGNEEPISVDLTMRSQWPLHGAEVSLRFYSLVGDGKFRIYRGATLIGTGFIDATGSGVPNAVVRLAPGDYRIVVKHGSSVSDRLITIPKEQNAQIDVDLDK